MMKWLKEKWRRFYLTFISLKGPPEKIALALSLGFWIAWFPIIGTHSILALALAAVFRVSVPAVYLGSWICNPITIPLILFVDYYVGAALVGYADLTGVSFSHLTWNGTVSLGWGIVYPMIVGGLILGTLNAVLAYRPAKRALIRSRDASDAASGQA